MRTMAVDRTKHTRGAILAARTASEQAARRAGAARKLLKLARRLGDEDMVAVAEEALVEARAHHRDTLSEMAEALRIGTAA